MLVLFPVNQGLPMRRQAHRLLVLFCLPLLSACTVFGDIDANIAPYEVVEADGDVDIDADVEPDVENDGDSDADNRPAPPPRTSRFFPPRSSMHRIPRLPARSRIPGAEAAAGDPWLPLPGEIFQKTTDRIHPHPGYNRIASSGFPKPRIAATYPVDPSEFPRRHPGP